MPFAPVPGSKTELPVLDFEDQSAWERWLEQNHATAPGVWLRFAKKGAPTSSIRHPEALDAAICFGWIDGQGRAQDEHFWLVRFTPRSPRSKWSQVNRRKAEGLIAQGRMRPAGLKAIKAAKDDGRWDAAYPPQGNAPVPDDLQKALDENPQAREFFETLTGANRYAFLYRLHNVKRPETRAKRIARYIEMLSAREKFHP